MNLRQQLEQREEQLLSQYAARSAKSQGRRCPEDECPLRPAFQHDRDRILYSKAFRRLKHKTQVFLAPTGDHYRTRLTHTLEVAQIARTLARGLRLNEDLTEAIALGHDLGHTPFGHAGESVLNRLLPEGFHHWEQSLRVVDVLEKDGEGLNLTHEVRMGIQGHSKGRGEFLPVQGHPLRRFGCVNAKEVRFVGANERDPQRLPGLDGDGRPVRVRMPLGMPEREAVGPGGINEPGREIR